MEAPRKRYQTNYIDGNNARQLYVVPDYSDEEYSKRRTRDNRQVKRQVRRRQERVKSMGLGQLLVLTLAIGATLFVCIDYLRVQSDITAMSRNVATMESDLLNLKNQNDAAEQRIDSSIDLAYIFEVATKELGMVYASGNQVIMYDSSKDDYVRQYDDIPPADDSSLIDKYIKK